jgi:hypothetical protein
MPHSVDPLRFRFLSVAIAVLIRCDCVNRLRSAAGFITVVCVVCGVDLGNYLGNHQGN